jgi:hypothetical protein
MQAIIRWYRQNYNQGSVTDYPSIDAPSPYIYSIYVLTAKAGNHEWESVSGCNFVSTLDDGLHLGRNM